jgi:hypothetical protein
VDMNFESLMIHVRRSLEVMIEDALKIEIIKVEVALDLSAERPDCPCLQLRGRSNINTLFFLSLTSVLRNKHGWARGS